MMRSDNVNCIVEMLNKFISGADRSISAARHLESAILASCGEDDRLEDLLDALASYHPQGGPYLYDEQAMAKKCAHALSIFHENTDQNEKHD